MDWTRAEQEWGFHPLCWPTPPRKRPHWWQRHERQSLRDLERLFGPLSNESLAQYWTEVSKGQSVYEDAGGYSLRCYAAMLGEAVAEPYTYVQAANDLVGGRHA